MRRVLLMVMVVIACKKPGEPAAGSAAPKIAAGSATGSATTPPAATAPTLPAAPAAVLAFDTGDSLEPGLAATFDHKVPRLPAISADGTQIATFDSDADGPMSTQPGYLAIRAIGDRKVSEQLALVDDKMATEAEAQGSAWPSPAVAQQLHTRAAAALARLRGFGSLQEVELKIDANGERHATKIGDLELTPEIVEDQYLVLTLRDGHGGVIHREDVQAYDEGTRDIGLDHPATCSYRPVLNGVFRDPTRKRLLAWIGYRYAEGCARSPQLYLPFSTDPGALPEPLVIAQFDLVGINSLDAATVLADHADLIAAGFVADQIKQIGVADHAMDYSGHDDHSVQVTLSRDGKSAWGSELARVTLLEQNQPGRDDAWRASDVMIKTAAGWRIAALAWTEPVDNAAANARARSGKLTVAKLDGEPGDAGLNAAFARLTTDGVDPVAATRPDLVAIGSGPGERSVGGASFARPWNAAWKGKVAIASSRARLAPSGTTGWVAATIELTKSGYKLPFTVFAVFDKTSGGGWSLVHIHFAVSPR